MFNFKCKIDVSLSVWGRGVGGGKWEVAGRGGKWGVLEGPGVCSISKARNNRVSIMNEI